MFLRSWSVKCGRAVFLVEWKFLFPLCRPDILLFLSKKSINCVWAALSHTFDIIGRIDIWRVFSGSLGSPDLRFGMTTADFHTCTKQFDANEVFIRLTMTGRVAGRMSLSTPADTLSTPRALFHGVCLTIFSKPCSVTAWNSNLFVRSWHYELDWLIREALLCAAYRPDSMSMSRFLDNSTASFMGSLLLGMEIMVTGDLNADFLPGSSCPEGWALTDLCNSLNLSQLVTPTNKDHWYIFDANWLGAYNKQELSYSLRCKYFGSLLIIASWRSHWISKLLVFSSGATKTTTLSYSEAIWCVSLFRLLIFLTTSMIKLTYSISFSRHTEWTRTN